MTVVLTIAGSDPSGGAGIQADLRTFAALGVVGVSVITALTVQNSQGVQSVHPVDSTLVAAQLDAILSDIKVDAVKIGMLGGASQVRAVAAALLKYQPPNVVLDPVLASTGGVPLLDSEGRDALLTELMPLCDLVTPNVPEAAEITGVVITDNNGLRLAAKCLREIGAKAVLLKGGHLNCEWSTDILVSESQEVGRSDTRVLTAHTHGTGCFLSSAIAAQLALGLPMDEAFFFAKRLLRRALLTPVVAGNGHGYPDAFAAANAIERHDYILHHQRVAALKGLYIVTDSQLMPLRSHEEIAIAAALGGANVFQIREKNMGTAMFTQSVVDVIEGTDVVRGDLLCIVNDRVDVALASNADGVHLGPDDMTPKDARRLLGLDKLVGVSVATLEEAKAVAPYASYFGVGAIFGSKTKLDAGKPIGVERIREIKAAFPHIPVVAIGGISAGNIAEVAAAGADAAAVVSAVVSAPDMEAATRELLTRFEAGKSRALP